MPLLPGTTYYARAKYTGEVRGTSEWSPTIHFDIPPDVVESNEVIITASDAATGNTFGYSVSVSSDGTRCIVGTLGASHSGIANSGKAYIFVKSGSSWIEEAILVASDITENANFGTSVSMSADGSRCVVGASSATALGVLSAGKAYVYVRVGASWYQEDMLTASDRETGSIFGGSVSISDDGYYCAVCASYATSSSLSVAGQVYIYKRTVSSWIQEAILSASDKTEFSVFGKSVDLSTNGTRCIVGADEMFVDIENRKGRAYIFTRTGTTWEQEAILAASDDAHGNSFGASVKVTPDSTRCIVGAYNAFKSGGIKTGQVYVFTRSGTSWVEEAILSPAAGLDYIFFGLSVGISDAGEECIIGARNSSPSDLESAGVAYLFTRVNTTWTETEIITASDKAMYDGFGLSVDISGSGSLKFVSSGGLVPPDTEEAGKVYIYS